MKKIFVLILFTMLLSSCSIIQFDDNIYPLTDNTYVFVDGKVYSGIDAAVAYDFYNELDGFKPIVFKLGNNE